MARLPKRTDQEWIDALAGRLGHEEQGKACQALANYLYVVAYNNLRKRQNHPPMLGHLNEAECTDLAEDFVQRFMEKMVNEQYHLLDKFSGRGHFTSWAAQVTLNLVASELRKASWQRQEPLNDHVPLAEETEQPEAVIMTQQLKESLQRCLQLLPARSRIALVRCIMEGDSASDVAAELGVTANTVHILVYRAKKRMAQYLASEGIGQGALVVFGH